MKNVGNGSAAPPATVARSGLRTLAIDIGGTGIKASVLDARGRMLTKRRRVATPHPCPPKSLLRALDELTAALPPFARISLGFPGVVRGGRIITAPHLGTELWRGYPLESSVSRHFGKPARLLNDAEVQGLGMVAGHGLEVVLTLGTGVGSAIFSDGRLAPHLELAHHPIHDGMTYDDYIGDATRLDVGTKKWNRRVAKTIGIVQLLLNYDLLYLGGGNATNVTVDLPTNVRVASNSAGLTGGIRLWDEDVWRVVRGEAAVRAATGKGSARGLLLPPTRAAASS